MRQDDEMIFELWDTESANLLMDGTLAEVTQYVYSLGQANPDSPSPGLVIVPAIP